MVQKYPKNRFSIFSQTAKFGPIQSHCQRRESRQMMNENLLCIHFRSTCFARFFCKSKHSVTRDRCYDFFKIFAQKMAFCLKTKLKFEKK
jgi:hypothetical protein